MNHIIEYIGKNGIKTTSWDIRRFQDPKPGDAVLFPENAPYPFNDRRVGRIDSVNGQSGWENEGEAHICCSMGSVFLSDGSVSISGGPFTVVPLDKLEFAGFKDLPFWNWGNNTAGAGQGVDYVIWRPAWALNLDGYDEFDGCWKKGGAA